MIKAVTFDLWHTLIYEPDDKFTRRTRMIRIRETWKALNENGHKISLDEVKVAYHSHDFMLEEIWSMWEDVTERTQIRMLLDCLGIKKGRKGLYEVLRTPYGDALLSNMPSLSDGIIGTLDALKEKGYSLGLISNTGRTAGRGMKEVMKRLGVLHQFDALTFSSDMKIRKPQSNIFNRSTRQSRGSKSFQTLSREWEESDEVICSGASDPGFDQVPRPEGRGAQVALSRFNFSLHRTAPDPYHIRVRGFPRERGRHRWGASCRPGAGTRRHGRRSGHEKSGS
jgi:putative hydrolase of the HAD superfamily